MNKLLTLAVVVCLGLALSGTAWGQAQATTGVIQGTVTDPSGAVVPGANAEAKNLDTNFTRTQTTDAGGRFAFLQMPPGRYTVTVTKQGFTTIVQENFSITVGEAVTLNLTLKVGAVSERVVVVDTPTVDLVKTESSSTLNDTTVSNTPILGRKFEDLLTLTPGVSIVQGPDGDEITFAGQRGIFNNISMDGGDYNNGFFGEQMGGQRAAVDITLEAVKEFQVVATGASAEFGRSGGSVVNIITKSGTNDVHGSLFHYQRLGGLTADTSDGKSLQDFHREQFGGAIGGPVIKDKLFFFGTFEQILGNLTRPNLSTPTGTPCSVTSPVVGTNDAQINASADCQRVALVNFMKAKVGNDEGLPVKHPLRNSAALGRMDWNINSSNTLGISYNFDYSKNENQTFDVPTYGTSANGTEGPSKINVLNGNLFTTISATKLNELHFTYSRENRPRGATKSNLAADTAMGFVNTFRFGNPFFLNPTIDEVFWRAQWSDKFSWVRGNHTWKMGGEWLHSRNTQVFRGFFTGRYIFSDVVGFLHYASPASLGAGYGPKAAVCPNGAWINLGSACPGGGSASGPLLLYLQHAASSGPTTDATGASDFANEDLALFIQDKWQVRPDLTINYGLRWEGQLFPDPFLAPSKTAYGVNLSDPRFPSDGTLHSQKKMFQPRLGFAWDVFNNRKAVLRASWGIYNARQNMLTQVGALTTNGVQQQTLVALSGFNSAGGDPPVWPNVITPPALPAGAFPFQPGVTVFSKDYANPRIYSFNTAYEQELTSHVSAYVDFTWSKGVHLTRFINPNAGSALFKNLGDVTDTVSSAKSLYRGITFGMKKRFSSRFQLEANYTYSQDWDDDSNERDPFTFRYFDVNHLDYEYSPSDRDERHKFNAYTYWEVGKGFVVNIRAQAHSAQPISPATRKGPDRNSLRKNNEYFSLDWRLQRPFKFRERYALIPQLDMFNTFNNANNVNPLISPGLFNFDGFLRQGVGDPLTVQLSAKFTF